MKNGNKIKVSVHTNGTHIKIVSEYDLINQNEGYNDKSIYLQATAFLLDLREPISNKQIDKYIAVAKINFENNHYDFKTTNRSEADAFITYNITGWTEIRPMVER